MRDAVMKTVSHMNMNVSAIHVSAIYVTWAGMHLGKAHDSHAYMLAWMDTVGGMNHVNIYK